IILLIFCVCRLRRQREKIMLIPALWVPAPTGGVLFPRRKSTQKGAGDQPPVPHLRGCLIGLYQIWDISATEFRSFSNLWSDYRRCSACRPLKGIHVSIGTCRNILHVTHCREYL